MIKNFIARNKSVFFIGLATLILFVAIIIVSGVRRAGNKNFGPKLVKFEESTESTSATLVGINADGIDDFVLEGSESSYSVLPEEQYAQIDYKYGTVRIEYSENGFYPRNAKAVLNQKIKWVNKTNQSIFIKQDSAFFREFKNPVIVPSNSAVEFRMYRSGTWSYKEQATERSGSVTILKP